MSTAGLKLEQLCAEPLSEYEKRRILITASCDDCQGIPKVHQAGETFSAAGSRIQLMHNGINVVEDGYCGRWMTVLIRVLQGHHEPQEERAFHELLDHVPRGGTMLELGSSWAYYSLWFHQRIPDAKLYMIEPDERNLDLGKRNFCLNEAPGEFFHYCVGRESRGPSPFRCDDGTSQLVPQICIDDFLGREGPPRVDVLLADIQGAELDMLHGAARSIDEGRIRFIVLSTHHHSISNDPLTHQECLRFLAERNAHFLAVHSVSESFSGDGLIVASFFPSDRHIAPIAVSRNWSTNNVFRELEYDLADCWQSRLEMGTQRGSHASMRLRFRSLARDMLPPFVWRLAAALAWRLGLA